MFVDAMHLLNSEHITKLNLQKAEKLLTTFVDQFEILFGKEHMVYNIHQLHHLTECVRQNGPLFTYSNYNMEDYIGHLVSFVQGTTDVTTQITSRYLLEKNFYIHLQKSAMARKYFEKIEANLSFAITEKIDGSLLIGIAKKISGLSSDEILIVKNTLKIAKDTQISEYDSILLNCKKFYEIFLNNSKKRTDDSFILNTENNRYAVIKSIILIEQRVYFFIIEKFKIDNDSSCKSIIFLKETDCYQQRIIPCTSIGPKCAVVKFEDKIAVSRFPNLYERN